MTEAHVRALDQRPTEGKLGEVLRRRVRVRLREHREGTAERVERGLLPPFFDLVECGSQGALPRACAARLISVTSESALFSDLAEYLAVFARASQTKNGFTSSVAQGIPSSAQVSSVVPVPQNGSSTGSSGNARDASNSRTRCTEYAGVRRSQP